MLNRRLVETSLTYFVVTFVLSGAAALAGVDVLDMHAVVAALIAAATGAAVATIKTVFPALTTLQEKDKA